MKTIKILILAFLLSSCAAQMGFNEHIQVYKHPGVGELRPSYLVLKTFDKTYDEYFYGTGGCGILGKFEVKGDTLCLVPKYEYGSRIKEINSEISVTTIPTYFLIKKDKLIEITDYKKYPELAPWINESAGGFDYIRIKIPKK